MAMDNGLRVNIGYSSNCFGTSQFLYLNLITTLPSEIPGQVRIWRTCAVQFCKNLTFTEGEYNIWRAGYQMMSGFLTNYLTRVMAGESGCVTALFGCFGTFITQATEIKANIRGPGP
jgi:hypothetical protein